MSPTDIAIALAALPREYAEDLNGVKLEMVKIPAGVFSMGEYVPVGEYVSVIGISNEVPAHLVWMKSFWMGKYEVTQAQWRAVMGTNPSKYKGDNLPVEQVSWNDAVEFCRKLSLMTGREYRLPSEAEWEYAARAGTTTQFAFGSSLSSSQANFNDSFSRVRPPRGAYRKKTTPVGSFSPNNFGLYDMHGNVWEWCQDWYHDNYSGAPADGSAWESGGEQKRRAMRGGSWDNMFIELRSAHRSSDEPDKRDKRYGLRVVLKSPVRS